MAFFRADKVDPYERFFNTHVHHVLLSQSVGIGERVSVVLVLQGRGKSELKEK